MLIVLIFQDNLRVHSYGRDVRAYRDYKIKKPGCLKISEYFSRIHRRNQCSQDNLPDLFLDG